MNRSIADWAWRITMLLLLAWVGTELHTLRQALSMTLDVEQETTTHLGRTPGVQGCEDYRLQVRGGRQRWLPAQPQPQPAANARRASPAVWLAAAASQRPQRLRGFRA